MPEPPGSLDIQLQEPTVFPSCLKYVRGLITLVTSRVVTVGAKACGWQTARTARKGGMLTGAGDAFVCQVPESHDGGPRVGCGHQKRILSWGMV